MIYERKTDTQQISLAEEAMKLLTEICVLQDLFTVRNGLHVSCVYTNENLITVLYIKLGTLVD